LNLACTLNHSTSAFFRRDFFEIGSLELFAQAGFKPWSSWSPPPWVARITGVITWLPLFLYGRKAFVWYVLSCTYIVFNHFFHFILVYPSQFKFPCQLALPPTSCLWLFWHMSFVLSASCYASKLPVVFHSGLNVLPWKCTTDFISNNTTHYI
jgi:hypothetical protein